MRLIARFFADLACILLVVVAHTLMLLATAWRAMHGGADPVSRAGIAALLWDLAWAALLGADMVVNSDGSVQIEPVSAWAARRRKTRLGCLLCRLLGVRWPTHCDDSVGLSYRLTPVRMPPPSP